MPSSNAVAVSVPFEALQEQVRAIMAGAEIAPTAIESADDYQHAGAILTTIKGRVKELDALRKSMTRPMDEVKKRLMEFFRPAEERLAKAEVMAKRAMLEYSQEQDRLRREEEDRRRAVAEDARRKEVEAARVHGDAEKAAELESAPMAVKNLPPPPVASGVSTRKVWRWRIADEALIPREFMLVDEKKLNAVAVSSKGGAHVPGVEFYQEEIVAASAR